MVTVPICLPHFCNVRVKSLSCTAFIGLPCPTKIEGMRFEGTDAFAPAKLAKLIRVDERAALTIFLLVWGMMVGAWM